MKSFTRLFPLLLFYFLPAGLLANAYVHGVVKNAAGTPLPNYLVHISGDSAAASNACNQSHIRFTNASGIYADTLLCGSNMTNVTVWITDSYGTIIQNRTFTATQIAEINFVVRDSLPATCVSSFYQTGITTTRQFFSGASHGAQTNDSILSRQWTFGDGTSLNGNTVNPIHTYAMPGTFAVCLKIKTVSGCEKTTCQNVTVTTNQNCIAYFTWRQLTTPRRMLFNSTYSYPSFVGDSILSRKWVFGDGDSLTGNIITPEHTFPAYGTYTVCLTIKTLSGCEKTQCWAITVYNPATSCTANFYYTFSPQNNLAVLFRGGYSQAIGGDSILTYQWKFGDGTTGNDSITTHTYTQPGIYNACLTIVSASGCRDSICKTITITNTQPRCEAVFYIDTIATPAGANPSYKYVKFNSTASHGATAGDSVVSRTWAFGDGSSLQGNQVSPIHGYAQPGNYNVCLYTTTASGCKDTLCRSVTIYTPPPTNCQPRFTTLASALTVTFNGSTSTSASGDSIVSRTWSFGDGITSNSNAAVLTHQYAQAGIYRACLTIRTRLGCVATTCKEFSIVPVTGNCVPYFTKEQVATPRTIRFNSSAAYSQIPNDSIIGRRWEFGDGQVLTGNVINPLHTYATGGTYTACLTIITVHCDKRWCQTIQVRPVDSTIQRDSISIVNLYPVPVTTQLNAVVFSVRNNVTAELAIYDVYGVKKWSQSVLLPAGNSTHNIPTAQLPAGPYIFKVTTQFGIKSRNFYKVI